MDLMTMWKQTQGEVALPEPEVGFTWYSADQMRAIATPDPETLRRFAEMVAEERAKDLRRELEVTDRLLTERERVLRAIPECPAHGPDCVPHALKWIALARATLGQ